MGGLRRRCNNEWQCPGLGIAAVPRRTRYEDEEYSGEPGPQGNPQFTLITVITLIPPTTLIPPITLITLITPTTLIPPITLITVIPPKKNYPKYLAPVFNVSFCTFFTYSIAFFVNFNASG
jgi:hypothetical protein